MIALMATVGTVRHCKEVRKRSDLIKVSVQMLFLKYKVHLCMSVLHCGALLSKWLYKSMLDDLCTKKTVFVQLTHWQTYDCVEEKSLEVVMETRVHHTTIVVEKEYIPHIKLAIL